MKSRFLTSLTVASTLVIGTLGSQVLSNSARAASITDFCTLTAIKSYTCSQTGSYPQFAPPVTNYPGLPDKSDAYVLVTNDLAGPIVPQQVLQAPPTIDLGGGNIAQLQGVSIVDWNANATGTVHVVNTGHTADSFVVKPLGAEASLFIPSSNAAAYVQTGNALIQPSAGVTSNVLQPGDFQDITLPPLTFNYSTPSGPPNFGNVSDQANFEGNGFFTGPNSIYVEANGVNYNISSVSGNGNGGGTVTTQVSGNFTIQYNYVVTATPNSVPEPSANVGLLVFGGLGLIRFLKSKQS